MCLLANRQATKDFISGLKDKKIKSITVYKEFYLNIKDAEKGCLALTSPYYNTTKKILNFGQIVSNRKSTQFSNRMINKGIHCYGYPDKEQAWYSTCVDKNEIFVEWLIDCCYEKDDWARIRIPVTIETNDIIGIEDGLILDKCGEIAALKINITRKVWRELKNLLKSEGLLKKGRDRL